MTKKPTWETQATPASEVHQSYRLTSLTALRSAMLARGFTSGYQLAQASGVGVSTVNHLVHGRRASASPKTVGKLREALGGDTDEVFVLDKSQVHRNHTHGNAA